MKRAKAGGRPALPPEERRETLSIRVTAAERAELAAAAERAEEPLTRWVVLAALYVARGGAPRRR